MSKKRLFFSFAGLVLCILAFKISVFLLNDRFSSSAVKHPLLITSPLPLPGKEEVEKILDQTFTYMGRGSQMFVFESQDGKYVLKLINFSRFRPHLFLGSKKRALKQEKEAHLFRSLAIANSHLKEECGLVYLHLHPSSEIRKQITIRDKLERHYTLDPATTPFILQKKGELLYPYFQKLMQQGKEEEAKEALSRLVALLLTRYRKGIQDEDAFLPKNAAFIQGTPSFIDLGQFALQKKEPSHRQEIEKITRKMARWFTEHSPSLARHLEYLIKDLI